jgi:opacity protein-like surface antigen
MKRMLIGVVSVLLLVAGSGTTSAEERNGVEAGIRMWINDWTIDEPLAGSITSDTTVLLGPAIEVKFPNHVFLDASYLFSLSDYTFSDNVSFISNFERQDANLAIGYMIVPEFGLLAGYKNSWVKEKERGIEQTVHGPLIGMIGIAPIYYSAAFYGRLDYLFTRFKQSGAVALNAINREESPGWTIEFGFKFDFTREFNGRIGYRYETNEGSNTNVRDSFSGLILGGMVAF